MIILCVLLGSLVSFVQLSTVDILKENEKAHKSSVIYRAFTGDNNKLTPKQYEEFITANLDQKTRSIGKRSLEIFKHKQDKSIGFIFQGLGFWDAITGIIILSDDLSTVKNIQFLNHKETPGLGARIEEQSFTDQFKGLTIDWNAPVGERVIVGASADPNAKNRVDAITGASQTSIALGAFLNTELEIIRSNLKDF